MSKTYVVADLHGRFDILAKALQVIGERALKHAIAGDKSKIIFLGDYIDRGPASADVIKTLRTGIEAGLPWIALMGNHEDMMIAALVDDDESMRQIWASNGGLETLTSYDPDQVQAVSPAIDDCQWLLNNTDLFYEDDHRIYVHASVPPEAIDLADASVYQLLWARPPKGSDIGYRGKHVVHGHTPTKKPELLKNRTNLDTGAVFGGPLSIGVFDDDTPGGPVEILEVRL